MGEGKYEVFRTFLLKWCLVSGKFFHYALLFSMNHVLHTKVFPGRFYLNAFK